MKMFEVSRPTIFRDYLKVLTTIREEHTLEFTDEGLTVLSMDKTHVEMLKLDLPMEYFDRWDIVEPVKMDLNIDELNRVLKRMNKQDWKMQLDYNHESNKAEFTLISDIRRSKTIPVLESIDEEVPSPKIYFKSKTKILLKTLKRIIEDFKVNGQHFIIETNQQEITFRSSSDYAEEHTTLDKDNDNILEHHVEEDSTATYNTEEFLDFLKSIVRISEVATLEFSEGMPLKLDVELPQGTLIYHLAPCIGV